MSYADELNADARLYILQELARQVDGQCNQVVLTRVLDGLGVRRSTDWLRTQLRVMAELGAVTISEAGTIMIAKLTRFGRDHVQQRQVIEGIARPADED